MSTKLDDSIEHCMHPCLGVVDILREIAENCSPATLASWAQVSVAWSDIALNKLWREQPGLRNLVRCLPERLWVVDIEGHVSLLDRPITLEDWSRFDFYARRIRFLDYAADDDQNAETKFIAFLAERYRLSPLLPNIKTLQFYRASAAPKFFEVLFGPRLRALHLVQAVLRTDTEAWPSLFSSLTYLPRLSPALEELTLIVTSHFTVSHLERLIPQLPHLRRLSLIACDIASRATLSDGLVHAISNLKDLDELNTSFGLRCPSTPIGSPAGAFPALRTLAFLDCPCDIVHLCTSFIRHYALTSLISFSLCLASLDGTSRRSAPASSQTMLPGALRDLVRTIVEVVSPKELIDLTLSYGSIEVDAATLRPLFSFAGLGSLDITCCPKLDDRACMEMARAWPKLIRLRIAGGHNQPATTGESSALELPPLESLAHFAHCCPKLAELSLQFDATKVPQLGPDARPREGPRNSFLTVLEVQRSPITWESKAQVAAFLSDIFPNLRTVRWTGHNGDGERSPWGEVENMLPVLSYVRRWGKLD